MEGEYEERHLSVGILIQACSLGMVGLVMSLAFFVFNIRFRNNRMIKMTSPNLNLILAGGGILLSTCCALYGLDYFLTNSTSAGTTVCQIRAGLLACGFSLLYGPMLAKAWRVYRLFREAGTRRVIIRDSQLLLPTGVLLLADIVLMVIWQSTDPLTFRPQLIFPQITPDSDVNTDTSALQPVRIMACTGESAPSWLAGFLVLKMALLSYGLFLSWQTRAVALPSMNDSKCIVVSTMTTVIMATFAVSISYLLHDKPDAVYACVVLSVWICATVGTCMAFVPKMALWWRNPEGKGIRLSVSSSTCSAYSMAALHNVDQIEEELVQTAAENEALRKSLEERDASIRQLQVHLTSAQTKLSQLGLNLDQKQDSGLDADLSSTDTDGGSVNKHPPSLTAVSFGLGDTPLCRLLREKCSLNIYSEVRNGCHSDSTSSEQSPRNSRSSLQFNDGGRPPRDVPVRTICSPTGQSQHFDNYPEQSKTIDEEFRYYDSLPADEVVRRGSGYSEKVHSLTDSTGRRGSNLTEKRVYSTDSRRSSKEITRKGRRDSRQTVSSDMKVRREITKREAKVGFVKDRQSRSFGESGVRDVSSRRVSDTAMLTLGRRSVSRSETNSERSYRRRRQHRRRHSATSIASVDQDQLSTIRDSIAQDLKHARSLSNMLGNTLNRDLDSVSRRYRRHVRRSSSSRSRDDLAESIVGSYGLEDDFDTRSFVSSFLPPCEPPPAADTGRATSPDAVSVLANDCLYPDRRQTRDRIMQMKLSPVTSRHKVAPPQDRFDNSQRVYTIQTARNPEYLSSGYAQTRVLHTFDTVI